MIDSSQPDQDGTLPGQPEHSMSQAPIRELDEGQRGEFLQELQQMHATAIHRVTAADLQDPAIANSCRSAIDHLLANFQPGDATGRSDDLQKLQHLYSLYPDLVEGCDPESLRRFIEVCLWAAPEMLPQALHTIGLSLDDDKAKGMVIRYLLRLLQSGHFSAGRFEVAGAIGIDYRDPAVRAVIREGMVKHCAENGYKITPVLEEALRHFDALEESQSIRMDALAEMLSQSTVRSYGQRYDGQGRFSGIKEAKDTLRSEECIRDERTEILNRAVGRMTQRKLIQFAESHCDPNIGYSREGYIRQLEERAPALAKQLFEDANAMIESAGQSDANFPRAILDGIAGYLGEERAVAAYDEDDGKGSTTYNTYWEAEGLLENLMKLHRERFPNAAHSSPALSKAIFVPLEKLLRQREIEKAFQLLNEFEFDPEEFPDSVRKELKAAIMFSLDPPSIGAHFTWHALMVRQMCNLDTQDPDLQRSAVAGIAKRICPHIGGDVQSPPEGISLLQLHEEVHWISGEFSLPDEIVQAEVRKGIAFAVEHNHYGPNAMRECIHDFAVEEECSFYPLSPWLVSIAETWNLKTIPDLFSFNDRHNTLTEYAKETPDRRIPLQKEHLPLLESLHLTPLEGVQLLLADPQSLASIDALPEAEKWSKLHAALREHCSDWSDGIVHRQFEAAAGVSATPSEGAQQSEGTPQGNDFPGFGIEKTLAFLHREGLSRHDGLHAMKDVIRCAKASGLTPAEFYNNVLKKVAEDTAVYEEGTSYHLFNGIVQSVDLRLDEIKNRAARYQDIAELGELIKIFRSPRDIFASWKQLKKYHSLCNVLQRGEMLEGLRTLKNQGKEALYRYVTVLAFHPSSKVDMQRVMQFWQAPEDFFDIPDNHDTYGAHELKKPSNYTHINHLDLHAEELRDAVVEGDIDQLQVFPPMRIRYEIPKKAETRSTQHLVRAALGSSKKKIKGEAKSEKQLFQKLNAFLKPYGGVIAYVSENSVSIPPAVEQELRTLVHDPACGMPAPEKYTLILEMHRKSDPLAVLAGNDTACCMPFGAGKSNSYMVMPVFAQFTARLCTQDGRERTIAQSVMSEDIDVGMLIPTVIEQVHNQKKKLSDVLPATMLQRNEGIVTQDDLEIAPNYQNERFDEIITTLCKDFFHCYLERHAASHAWKPDQVVVGLPTYDGFYDALRKQPTTPNTFAACTPSGYSDNLGAVAHTIAPQQAGPDVKREILDVEPIASRKEPPVGVRGVERLDFRDALRVAVLEGKGYSDNPSLMTHAHNMQNGLVAKDINNVRKKRVNMSFKYNDKNGKMRGYLLAYEGKYGCTAGEDDEVPDCGSVQRGDQVLYVSDLASDREDIYCGTRLIQAFTKEYKEHFLDKKNPIPVILEAREQTSYRILVKKLPKILKEAGIEDQVVREEPETYDAGPDKMHRIVLRPKQAD